MSEKIRKSLYEPPIAKNLTAFSADGQIKPPGMCTDGTQPVTNWCSGGAIPTQADACKPLGGLPTYGGCTTGGSAVEGCTSGGQPQPLL